MGTVFTAKWFKAALVRATKTFAQNMIGNLGAYTMFGSVNWIAVLSSSGLAALLSIFSAFAGLPEVDGKERSWFVAAFIRAIKTVAESGIATIGTAMLFSDVNWMAVGNAALLAGALSILTSIAGLPEVED